MDTWRKRTTESRSYFTDKYEDTGDFRGLVNPSGSNICWLNSLLQCLMRVPACQLLEGTYRAFCSRQCLTICTL